MRSGSSSEKFFSLRALILRRLHSSRAKVRRLNSDTRGDVILSHARAPPDRPRNRNQAPRRRSCRIDPQARPPSVPLPRPCARTQRALRHARFRPSQPGSPSASSHRDPSSLDAHSGGLPRVVITSKSPASDSGRSRYKEKLERELVVRSPRGWPAKLRSLGFRPGFLYEKFRTTFRLPGLHLDLDEIPWALFSKSRAGPKPSIASLAPSEASHCWVR